MKHIIEDDCHKNTNQSTEDNLTIGENVVYGLSEICKIDGIEDKSFDGINKTRYYKLIPLYSQKSAYFIPADTINTKVRKLLTKEEIYSLIDDIPNIEPIWYEDAHERKIEFGSVLKSDDYKQIISIIKSLYNYKQERLSFGKKLAGCDERIMVNAENMMYQEFSTVLGMQYDKVKDFIISKIGD